MLLLWGHGIFFLFADQTGSVFVFWGQTAASPLVPQNRTSHIYFFFFFYSAVSVELKPSRVVFFFPLTSSSPNPPLGLAVPADNILTPEMLPKSEWAANWSASLLSLRVAQLQHKPKGKTQMLFLRSIGSAIFLAEPLDSGLHQERLAYRSASPKSNTWYLEPNAWFFFLNTFPSPAGVSLARFAKQITSVSLRGRLARAETFTNPFFPRRQHI